tara:strand:- start:50755 stop:51042 length:288 start_codon:yes stop_codon:yes gene_type:complete
MGTGINVLRTTSDILGRLDEVERSWREVLRCRLITEVRASTGLENLAETSRFYSADIFRSSEASAEPVVFSRATQVRAHFFKRQEGVKTKMISDW